LNITGQGVPFLASNQIEILMAVTNVLSFSLFCIVGIMASEVLPNVADLCASFQYMVVNHLAKRVQRALLFCELKKLLPTDRRTLVCNYYLPFRLSSLALVRR